MLKIGDFSSLAQVPVKTLRYYDEIRLLSAAHRSSLTGYRFYSVQQLARLYEILSLKQLGFSLKQIKAIVEAQLPTSKIRIMLEARKAELRSVVRSEQAVLDHVEAWIRQIDRDGSLPAHEIVVRPEKARLVASLRDTLRSYQDAEALFEEVEHHLNKHNALGRRGAIWHTCESKHRAIDCETLVFLEQSVPCTRRIQVYELPGSRVACTLHCGSDDELPKAYTTMRAWMKDHRYRTAGPNREIYLDWEPETESGVTEIQFPVIPKPVTDCAHNLS